MAILTRHRAPTLQHHGRALINAHSHKAGLIATTGVVRKDSAICRLGLGALGTLGRWLFHTSYVQCSTQLKKKKKKLVRSRLFDSCMFTLASELRTGTRRNPAQ